MDSDASRSPASTPPEVLRIATSGDYPPFTVWPEGGDPSGFSVAVARAYAADHGLGLEWVRFRWPELASDLAAGAFDLALSGVTVRPDRSILGRFSLPLTTSGAIVLVWAKSPLVSVADLDRPSIAIAVNAGGHLERVARRLFPHARIEAIPDNAGVAARLSTDTALHDPNGVDAVVTDSIEAPLWQRDAATALRAIGPLTRDLKAAWFARSRAAEARRFDRWLLHAEANGVLATLRRAHGLPTEATARPGYALLSSLDERLALMPAVADAKAVLGVPIEDPSRERVVLEAATRAVEAAALEAGVDAPDHGAVLHLFRAQIEAAKWIQSERRKWQPARETAPSAAERAAARARLDEAIRPALLYLGERISMLIVECRRRPPEQLRFEEVALALGRHALPDPLLRALHDALVETLIPAAAAERARPRPLAATDRTPSAPMQRAHP